MSSDEAFFLDIEGFFNDFAGTNKKVVTLVDVRPSELSQAGNIPNSINIPLEVLEEEFFNLSQTTFLTKYGIARPKKDDIIIVYCENGIRSTKAKGILKNHGYTNVKNYKGGYPDYEKNIKGAEDQSQVTFIDVREDSQPSTAESKCKTTTINIPLDILEYDFAEISDEEFQAKYDRSRPKQNDPILVICGTDKRTWKAITILRDLGFTNIKECKFH